ncbi:hypothetical protein [Rhizobium leguminosarum]|uniref:hypothetical protein n=1 Tax=Rhizobium leguminosarum TaxID=384 RepID=UPI002E13D98A|nr:hypothetical protein U8Q02_40805 [Rhizobium leguminosarum]
MTLPSKPSFWFQTFVGGFSLYAACSLVLTAIYAALLEDGLAGLAVPPLMAGVGAGFITALVSLVSMEDAAASRDCSLAPPAPSPDEESKL